MTKYWRLLLWLVVTLGALALIVWLGQQPGRLRIDWFGYTVETPAWLGLVAAILVFLFGAATMRLVIYFARDFPLSRPQRQRRRRARAKARIKEALAALASEEWAKALKRAEEAVGLCEDPFAHWLAAEAAERLGEKERAAGHWLALEGDPAFQMLSLRQRAEAARANADWETLRALAGAAFAVHPDSPWAARRLFEAFVHLGAYAQADALLDKLQRLGLIDAQTAAGRRAALLTAQAQALLEEEDGKPSAAPRRKLTQALKLAPGFAPAAALLLRATAAQGGEKEALKQAKRRLLQHPHGAVLHELASLLAAQPPAQRRRSLEELLGPDPETPEARLLLAEAALAAGDREEAESWLKTITTERPDRRAMLLRARLAQAAGDREAAAHWRRRAETEGVEPGWICSACGAKAADWRITCPGCGEIASLVWGYPPARAAVADRGPDRAPRLLPG